jgi:hypothetical protein
MNKTEIAIATITATLLLVGALLALNFQWLSSFAFLAGGILGLFSLEAINGNL